MEGFCPSLDDPVCFRCIACVESQNKSGVEKKSLTLLSDRTIFFDGVLLFALQLSQNKLKLQKKNSNKNVLISELYAV